MFKFPAKWVGRKLRRLFISMEMLRIFSKVPVSCRICLIRYKLPYWSFNTRHTAVMLLPMASLFQIGLKKMLSNFTNSYCYRNIKIRI